MSIRERWKQRNILVAELMGMSQQKVVEMYVDLKRDWDKAVWHEEMSTQEKKTIEALSAECEQLRKHVREQDEHIQRLRSMNGNRG